MSNDSQTGDLDHVGDLDAFVGFLSALPDHKRTQLSPEQSVEQFRAYQRELNDLREKLRVAEEDIAAGRVGPLDPEATIRAVRHRLAQEGVSE